MDIRHWKKLVSRKCWDEFKQKNLVEWIDWNVKNARIGRERSASWQFIFQTTVYEAWCMRCSISAGDGGHGGRSISDTYILMEAARAEATNSFNGGKEREWNYIGWNKPEGEWVKINVDVAVKGVLGKVGAGGLIRNEMGVWLGGFCANFGKASRLVAELWGMLFGLRLTWQLGYRKMIFENDSLSDIKLVEDAPPESPHINLILEIKK